MSAHVHSIQRYPVKGLSAEMLEAVELTQGEALPFDRAYAIENGPGAFDLSAPRHLPKVAFLCQMRHERLAELQTVFDEVTRELALARGGVELARGRLTTPEGRGAVEAFFVREFADELRGAPRVVFAPGHSFSDVKARCVHIINLASLRALATLLGVVIDPRRFRANMLVDGLEAWAELDMVGQEIRLGSARLAVFKRTERCAATNVNPATAVRDMTLPERLDALLGHRDFGIYATVVDGGIVKVGDRVDG